MSSLSFSSFIWCCRVRMYEVACRSLHTLLWPFLLLVCLQGGAETFKAPNPGLGIAPITGLWQFHTGDDLAWANPAFNDTRWQAIRGDQPWGGQGHPDYTGWAWYRKRLEVGAVNQPLGIFIPEATGAYEVYWNGQRIGSSGSLPPHAGWYALGQNAAFALSEGSGETAGVLAFRFWAPPQPTINDPTDGGLREAVQVGRLTLVQQQMQFEALRREHARVVSSTVSVLLAAVALLSFLGYLRQRRELIYLWLSILLLGNVLADVSSRLTRTISFAPNEALQEVASGCMYVGICLTLLWIFDLHRSRRWRLITIGVISVYLTAMVIDDTLAWFWQYAGPGMARTDLVATELYAALEILPVFLVGFGLRRQRTSSLVPLGLVAALAAFWPPLANLADIFASRSDLALGRPIFDWHLQLGDYVCHPDTFFNWLFIVILVLTLVPRQLREGRRQAHLEQEVRSAQEVQHVLIPESSPRIPGLEVDSVYKPAAEVGGDFFQVLPAAPGMAHAGTLIVVGDVSGKGLKAAMTVSLIVGTLRTLAEVTGSPAAVLAGINRRLMGRIQGGFATCLVLRIDPDGTTTLANAGHLPPFRNGVEWDIPPSLPLGLTADAVYEEVNTRLRENEMLTLITDGVLEARNREGELYGFERVAALMRARPTAQAVAEAACSFGQDDDITVVSVARCPILEPLPAASLLTTTA